MARRDAASGRLQRRAGLRLVQLLADVLDALGDQSPASLPLVSAVRIFSAAATAASAAAAAHVGGGLRLGLGDLGFGHLGAAGDEILDLGLGLDRQPLGFGLGAGDDVLRLAFGGLPLALIFGQQLRRLVLAACALRRVRP